MVFTFDETFEAIAKIKVIGIGGAGGNAINRMVSEGLENVEFIAVNTDAQDLNNNRANNRVQIGDKITKGLGAGASPEVGRAAMEEDRKMIAEKVQGADMVFITAGMGGGTGTGGAPIVAQICREMDILTVGIVTKPFKFEGPIRAKKAMTGIEELRRHVDTLIAIPNQKLLSVVEKQTSLLEGFAKADDVLYHATKGISDLITINGIVNIDFADARTIMADKGYAIMGTGIASGDDRAVEAATKAIHSPLLDESDLMGAEGILVNVTGGPDLGLHDVNDATETIYEAVGHNDSSNIIFGAVVDPEMEGQIRVTVVAAGFENERKVLKQGAISSQTGSVQKRETVTPIPKKQPPIQTEAEREPVVEAPIQEQIEAEPIKGAAPIIPHKSTMESRAPAMDQGEAIDLWDQVKSESEDPLKMDKSLERVTQIKIERVQLKKIKSAELEMLSQEPEVDSQDPEIQRPSKVIRELRADHIYSKMALEADDLEIPTFIRQRNE